MRRREEDPRERAHDGTEKEEGEGEDKDVRELEGVDGSRLRVRQLRVHEEEDRNEHQHHELAVEDVQNWLEVWMQPSYPRGNAVQCELEDEREGNESDDQPVRQRFVDRALTATACHCGTRGKCGERRRRKQCVGAA
ncbi:hypothetical protein FGB62_341g01 [Gracilaria domingensis]|nr:hypothetical protein FGB62_341g01 [Gracilaria domingensis]